MSLELNIEQGEKMLLEELMSRAVYDEISPEEFKDLRKLETKYPEDAEKIRKEATQYKTASAVKGSLRLAK